MGPVGNRQPSRFSVAPVVADELSTNLHAYVGNLLVPTSSGYFGGSRT